MIARLAGTLLDKQPGAAVVDVGGVGYQVSIPLSTYYELGEPGSRVELHVHTHVREDAIALFGFHTLFEKEIFSRLIGVSDVVRLSSVPGIGRKTAERIVVDLADRIESLRPSLAPGTAAEQGARGADSDLRQDLVSALVNLGYNARVAADAAGRVLKAADAPSPPFQALLRETLRILSR